MDPMAFSIGVVTGMVAAILATWTGEWRRRRGPPILHANGDITYSGVRWALMDAAGHWARCDTGEYSDMHSRLTNMRIILSRPQQPEPAPKGGLSEAAPSPVAAGKEKP
jgi:hypothetical protein